MEQPPAPKDLRPVNPHVWRACAGPSAWIPSVGADVVYFPEGHAEQCASPPAFSGVGSSPAVPCRVVDLRYLANPDTEEVFCKICLDPGLLRSPMPPPAAPERSDGESVVSFAKVLTPSDANNGGGFSVPRFCADSIFPPLDMDKEPPVQYIFVTDVQGGRWKFRHIYRGTPRRHLLTTGWSKFVNSKKLVAGDSVVFIKNLVGELFVGIRRTVRFSSVSQYLPNNLTNKTDSLGSGAGFFRNVRGRVPASTVLEAVRLAESGRPFEVMYYPRVGSTDFVVAREAVERAISSRWMPGMRIKMPMEAEDSARMTWYQGTVSSVTVKDTAPWSRSPWRMLQVTWDEPEAIQLQNVTSVSPWQVELLPSTSQMQSSYPVLKKLRMTESSEILGDGDGSMFFHMTGFQNNSMGGFPSQLLSYPSFPAGMQGARHDSICEPSSSAPVNANHAFSDSLHVIDMGLNINNVSSGMNNIASPKQSQFLCSPNEEIFLNSAPEPLKEVREACFRLFGQSIPISKPDGEDGKKDVKEKKEDAMQCQRISSLEACSL